MHVLSPASLTLLVEFLVDSFQAVELVRLVELTFGRAVAADLPGSSESPRSFMFEAVRVLLRRGLLDSRFFGALAQDRPDRRAEIRRIAAELRVDAAEACESETLVYRRSPPTPQESRITWVETLERHLLARARKSIDDEGRLDRAIDSLARRLRDQPAPTAGCVLAGTRLEGIIGAGTFGTLWRARHLRSGELVATKVFNLERLTEGVMLWRFRRNIRALQTLHQYRDVPPAIPRILAVSDDTLAFAMPLFAEGTLEQIERRGWSLSTKIGVFLAVCRAAEFAHRRGVIHRDIQPANVLLDEMLCPALVGYDSAEIRFVTELPAAGGGLRTPVFAAPEQLESAAEADERSDIYSLGRLFYYILRERAPRYQIEREPTLADLRDFPPALVAIVRRAILWEPCGRFASVAELIAAVERYHSGRAAITARLADAYRWIRAHAMLLTTCATITSASAQCASRQQGKAAEKVREHEIQQSEQDLPIRACSSPSGSCAPRRRGSCDSSRGKS